MKFFTIVYLVIIPSSLAFGQLEFTKRDKWLFVGADSIEGKRIISGVYISPIDSSHLNLKIDILDNWVKKDSIDVKVILDESSIKSDHYFVILDKKKVSAYRFYNVDGFEILIAKERWHDNSYDQKGVKLERTYSLSIVEVKWTEDKKRYVKTLPVMYGK